MARLFRNALARSIVAAAFAVAWSAAPSSALQGTEARALAVPDSLDGWVEAQMAERRIPGLTLAIARDGVAVTERAYGLADVGLGVPVTTETRFALASLTKQFTAAAILMLAEEDRVDLDASVLEFLPSDAPREWAPVTPRHLLTHTSGLPPIGQGFSGGEGGLYQKWWIPRTVAWRAARADRLRTAPGEAFAYSDVGYFVLGMVVETAGGATWRDFVQTRILDPLGMTDTFFIDHIGVHRDVADGYTLRAGELTRLHRPWQFELPSHFGLFSNVGDLVRWDAALRGEKLLSEASKREMWTPVRLNDGETAPYGFGWEVDRLDGRLVVYHTGITGTEIVRVPEAGITVIVLTNLGRGFGGDANAWGIARDIARMLGAF
jgi:CubicO group peptidase (beta-lactamase class C family)